MRFGICCGAFFIDIIYCSAYQGGAKGIGLRRFGPMNLHSTTRHDPRRSILVNGAAYRREMNRKPEPTVSLMQSSAMALALAVFVVGGLMFAAGVL